MKLEEIMKKIDELPTRSRDPRKNVRRIQAFVEWTRLESD